MKRFPAVAGLFYPSDPNRLTQQIKDFSDLPERVSSKRPVKGVVSPHAGYMYSGRIAGQLFSRILIPPNVIIIGPNHTGIGKRVALMAEGQWEMPNGPVKISRELAEQILSQSSLITADSLAHQREHSLEVQLPFLQYFNPQISIVPICVGFLDYSEIQEIGKSIATVIKRFTPLPLIIASSDMTHYESQKSAERKDRLAINKILDLNPLGLYKIVDQENISMCGVIPTTIMLVSALELGAKKAELVAYSTSGEVSGDYSQVVGYAGIIVE